MWKRTQDGGLVARPTLRIPVATDLALWTGDGLSIPIDLELARLKALVNGVEEDAVDIWAKYRESGWRLPNFGAPGPGDEPPPILPIRDLLS